MAGTRRRHPRGALVGAVALAALLAACGSSSKQQGSGTLVTTASTAPKPKAPPAVQLLASDGAAGDYLGGALYYDTFVTPIKPTYYATPGEAAMSSAGTVALVGAPGNAKGTGAAYVFAKKGSAWSQTAKLTAADGALYDGLGWSVALSGDGLTAVAGAPYKNTAKNEDIGSAYVFHNTNGKWAQIAELRGADSAAYDGFGFSVAMSRDGNWLMVGSPAHTVNAKKGAGSAYLFRRNGNTFTLVRQFVAGNGVEQDNFGSYVALSADGSTIAITRQSHYDPQHQYHVGATYLYRTTNAWKTVAAPVVFVDTNKNADGQSDQYGVNVVLSDDGRVAAVAAPDVNIGKAGGAGATYVYMTNAGWSAPAKNTTINLLPTVPAPFAYYGSSVALSSNGRILWIGVDGVGSNGQGAGVVVVLPAPGTPTAGASVSAPKQIAVPPPHSDQGRFGTAVAISADGSTMLSTSPWLPVGSKAHQGAAYILHAPATGS